MWFCIFDSFYLAIRNGSKALMIAKEQSPHSRILRFRTTVIDFRKNLVACEDLDQRPVVSWT